MSADALYVLDEAGKYVSAPEDQIVSEAMRLRGLHLQRGALLTNTRAVKEYLTLRYAHLEHEVFAVIFVDARNRVLASEDMFRGTIDASVVHPREVVKAALRHNAAAVIFVHNHPSGEPDPSPADELMTNKLKAALALIDVRVLDHLVVGRDFVESFSERGLL